MKRRTLCRVLSLPLLAVAQRTAAQPKPALRVAWVSLERANSSSPVFAAFRTGMAELGYVEGNNLVIEAWWGDGSATRLEQQRADMLAARPDVIVAQGGVALGPMLHPSVDRPVLFSMSGDPVAAKIVASYAQPGGNATGITLFAAELTAKRMALLKEMLPGMRSIAVIANPRHPGPISPGPAVMPSWSLRTALRCSTRTALPRSRCTSASRWWPAGRRSRSRAT
jgi:putative ABC transport system substrate-binding protein